MFTNKQELEEIGIDTFQNEAQREKLVQKNEDFQWLWDNIKQSNIQ